jgi:5'-nucleotidase
MQPFPVPRVRAALSLVVALLFSVPVLGGPPRSKTIRVTLLQVNDVYQISPVDRGERGGLARVATLERRISATSPNTLFILGGDALSPSVASNIFKGRQMIDVFNAAGLDYAALGNHEFDFGDEVLLERMRASKFVWLGANVVNRRTGRPFGGTPPFVIREFDGVKVGIFGLVTRDTKTASKPGPDVVFLDPVATAARIVRRLRAKGVRVVVALTHLSMAEDKQLARRVPVDVILGGHEHTLLMSHAGRTPILKMGSDARNLGRIDLLISRATRSVESIDWEVIPVTKSVPDEPQTAAVVAEYENKLSVELDKPLGSTTVELDAQQASNRSRETNLGSFVADAYRAALGADVALINGGSIRSNTTYDPGPVTKRHVFEILPFEDPVVKIEVTGRMLRTALENGVSRITESLEEGRFPQVSGLRFVYDAARQSGSRVVSVTVGGSPLDDTKTYTLATTTFLSHGGDDYAVLKSAKVLTSEEDGPVSAIIVMNAIQTAGTIAPAVDGRIERK